MFWLLSHTLFYIPLSQPASYPYQFPSSPPDSCLFCDPFSLIKALCVTTVPELAART